MCNEKYINIYISPTKSQAYRAFVPYNCTFAETGLWMTLLSAFEPQMHQSGFFPCIVYRSLELLLFLDLGPLFLAFVAIQTPPR
jgi:hypothetical protein